MRSYEQLIEYIINDETEKAKELFHSLVVEKSREIYNDLVAEEMDMDEAHGDETDDMMGDIEADHDGLDMDHDEPMDHDEGGEFGGEEHDEGSVEDRVMDLEDALDELKAEFEALMADEAGEEEHHDGVTDPDFGDMDSDEMSAEGMVREYVEKVTSPGNTEGQGVGAGSIGGATNSKSTVAGKNDMGGTAHNIARGDMGENPDDKQYKEPSNQYSKGKGNLPGAGNFENVPGANAGKAFSNAKKPTTSEPSGVNKRTPLAR
jgi:hypothetical protein